MNELLQTCHSDWLTLVNNQLAVLHGTTHVKHVLHVRIQVLHVRIQVLHVRIQVDVNMVYWYVAFIHIHTR